MKYCNNTGPRDWEQLETMDFGIYLCLPFDPKFAVIPGSLPAMSKFVMRESRFRVGEIWK